MQTGSVIFPRNMSQLFFLCSNTDRLFLKKNVAESLIFHMRIVYTSWDIGTSIVFSVIDNFIFFQNFHC